MKPGRQGVEGLRNSFALTFHGKKILILTSHSLTLILQILTVTSVHSAHKHLSKGHPPFQLPCP